MTTPDFDKVQSRLYEGVQKFDYFLTGVSAAVLAYSVESYAPAPGEAARWLVPFAWVLLGISFYSGLMHQQRLLQLMAVILEVHVRHERFDELTAVQHKQALQSRGDQLAEEALETSRQFQANENSLSGLYKQQDSLPRTMIRWDRSRGICFLAGVGALAVWKLINFWAAGA